MFFSERCDYDDNKILILKNLSFLSITSSVIITRFFKFIVKNDSNENNFDINHSKDLNRKRLTLTFKAFKEKKIQKSNLIDIVEINVLTYYDLIRNKENKLFSLIINEIYDIESFEIHL